MDDRDPICCGVALGLVLALLVMPFPATAQL